MRKAGDGRWITICANGAQYKSAFVVAATGANQVPNMPAFPGLADFNGRVIYKSATDDGCSYRAACRARTSARRSSERCRLTSTLRA